MNDNLYSKAIKEALKVEFLANSEELFLYAGALYSAMIWGREVDEENKKIRKLNRSVK
jgi:hypothetical protein